MFATVTAVLISAVAASPGPPPDEVGFEILVAGGLPSGFRIDSSETITTFDGSPELAQRAPETGTGKPGDYAFARDQLMRYRSLADDGCAAKAGDVIAFRLTWREGGALHRVDFADSCKGVPTDLIDVVRPIAMRVEQRMAPSVEGTVAIDLQ